MLYLDTLCHSTSTGSGARCAGAQRFGGDSDVHNHPAGIAEPNQSDTTLIKRLRDSLALVEVRLLDHLVVGDCEFILMSDQGLI